MNFASPVAVGEHLYGLGPSANLICVEIESGKQTWSKNGYFTTSKDKAHGGFIAFRNSILALTDAGQLVLFASDPKEFKELGTAQVVKKDGDVAAAFARAAKRITATYHVPYISHAPMEPPCAFVHVDGDRGRVIASLQQPGGAAAQLRALGVPTQNLSVEMTRAGGGFGRRLTNDYVGEAAMLSKAIGGPVKLMWTREDDLRHDFYRPTGWHELSAGLDADGRIVGWSHRLASASKY